MAPRHPRHTRKPAWPCQRLRRWKAALSRGRFEHFCLVVDDFDLEATRAQLAAEGYETVEIAENLLTADPDGILVQIVDSDLVFYHEKSGETGETS